MSDREPQAFNLRGRQEGARPELDDLASLRASGGGSSRSYLLVPASQGSEASTSDSNGPACKWCGKPKPMSTDGTCCEQGSPESPAPTTCEPSEPQTFDWMAGGATDKTWGGKSRIWVEDPPGRTRSLQANKTLAVWIPSGFSVEGSPAKTCPSQDDAQDSTASVPASSSSSPESPMTLFTPEGLSSLRTFPDSFPHNPDEISPSFSRRWPASGFTTSPGECWTADTSECPNDAAAFSSLADVLQETVARKYFLSPKAAVGILRRATNRGRQLPSHLSAALEQVARTTTTDKQGGS